MSSTVSFNYYTADYAAALARMDAAAAADTRKSSKRKGAPPTDADYPPEKAPMPMTDDEIRERVARFMADIRDRNCDQRIVVGWVMDTPYINIQRMWTVEQIVAAAFAAKFAA